LGRGNQTVVWDESDTYDVNDGVDCRPVATVNVFKPILNRPQQIAPSRPAATSTIIESMGCAKALLKASAMLAAFMMKSLSQTK